MFFIHFEGSGKKKVFFQIKKVYLFDQKYGQKIYFVKYFCNLK